VARLPRLCLANTLTYVRQYALEELHVFDRDEDCDSLVPMLSDAVTEHEVALHGFALTPNRFDLLLTPTRADDVARLLQSLSRRFVRTYNLRHQRQGVLWRQRYRSTLVDPEWGLACSRYIDTLASRLGLAEVPEYYPWSSAGTWLGHANPRLRLTPLNAYWDLANTPFERQSAYRACLVQPLPDPIIARIDAAVEKAWPLGEPTWLTQLQTRLTRRLEPLRRGRPTRQV
jgi:putative transposase